MSESEVTHDEMDRLTDLPQRGLRHEERLRLSHYIAQNRKRDDDAAARAKTLEEFATLAVSELRKIRSRDGTTGASDTSDSIRWIIDNFPRLELKPDKAWAETLEEFREEAIRQWCLLVAIPGENHVSDWLTWIIDSFPQTEPKPDKLDRLVAALLAANDGENGPVKWLAMSRRGLFCMLNRVGDKSFVQSETGCWRAVGHMIFHLEKPKPITDQLAAEAAKRIRIERGADGQCDSSDDVLERYFDQKGGESDE